MKILSAKQIQEVDQYTIENEPITSINLMERAASAFTDAFFSLVSPKRRVAVVAGRGNNGGDGLAIARMLISKHYEVDVYVIEPEKKTSEDFRVNEKRLKSVATIHSITDHASIPHFADYDVLIDGIFGSGLSRPVEGLYADVISQINASRNFIIAIDIASGLFADSMSDDGAIVKATHTISFQLPKLAFLLPENFQYNGQWQAVDIGLSQTFIDHQTTPYTYLTHELVKNIIRPRGKYDHKGSNGRALMMTGSYGKMGAAILTGRAAMKAGLGLLTMYVPGCGYEIVQNSVPEAMAIVDEGDHFLTTCPPVEGYDVIGIGPGIGKEQETVMSLIEMVRAFDQPIVLDADALNIIAEHREILEMLPEQSVITPHPKEFERLVGAWANDFEKLEKQKILAREHKLVVVLKGAHTTISTPDGHFFFNSTGNPGMATGGSGDVLTGIITALLAQGYTSTEAACLGTFIHGLAGDVAAVNCGQISMVASDIIDNLPHAFLSLEN